MTRLNLIILFLLGFGLSSFAPSAPLGGVSKNCKTFAKWMIGDFSNRSQARKYDEFDYREMHIIKVFPKADKYAIWLYEETMNAEVEGEVIRQRFYRISDIDNAQLEVQVYTMFGEDVDPYEWQNKKPFDGYSPDDLVSSPECSYTFVKKGSTKFEGTTYGKECTLDLGEANYVTSELLVYETKIYRKDIGIGDFDEQEWGPDPDSKGYYYKRYDPKKR